MTGSGASPESARSENGRRRRLERFAAAACLAFAGLHLLAVFSRAPVLPEDDAFITMRYAANLAAGRGLVYNSGERVLGTTSPLFALLLAPVARIRGAAALPATAVWLNGALMLVAALVLVRLLRSFAIDPSLASLAGGWLLLSPTGISVGLGGMDTWLASCLALAAFLAGSERRWQLAGALAALTCIARPEGGLVLAGLAWVYLRSGSPRRLPVVVATAAPLLVWVGFATAYFGSPVPQSLRAKLAPLYEPPRGESLWAVARTLADALLGSESAAAMVGAAVLAALLLGLAMRRSRTRPVLGAIGAYFLLLVVEFAVGNPGWSPWYPALFLVPLAAVVFAGLAEAGELVAMHRPVVASAPRLLAWLLVVTAAVGDLAATALPNWPATAYRVYTPYRLRTLAYRDAAAWLEQQAPAGTTIVAAEIGILGFVDAGARIVDATALVSPEAQRFLPVRGPGNPYGGLIDPRLVRLAKPTFVVTLPMHAGLLQSDPDFLRNYRLAGLFPVPGGRYPQYTLGVYRRVRSDAGAAGTAPSRPSDRSSPGPPA